MPLSKDDHKFILNALRQASVIWSGRKEILNLSRQKVFVRNSKDGVPLYKYYWQCASCQDWVKNQKDVEVDHVVEIGGLENFVGDWTELVNKIFPRPVEKHLQCLCVACHARKTGKYNSARSKWERKKNPR